MLENLSFVKVVSVQAVPGVNKITYTGEAVEVNFRDARERPKLVFFDKFGRSRSLLKVGPIQLAQAPMGYEHPSAVPTVGELLVGSLVPNTRKSHLEHVLRGWSSDAKPLWELLRILKFGTRASEFECRSMLVQPASNLLQSSAALKQVRDDIYMTARVILWHSLRPLQVLATLQTSGIVLDPAPTEVEIQQAKGLRLSASALDFVDQLTLKLNDSAISEAFQEGLTLPEPEPSFVPTASTWSTINGHAAGASYGGAGASYGPPRTAYDGPPGPASQAYGASAAAPVAYYYPTSPPGSPPVSPRGSSRGAAQGPGAESEAARPYSPTSPAYAPASPAYRPASPQVYTYTVGQDDGQPVASAPPASPNYELYDADMAEDR